MKIGVSRGTLTGKAGPRIAIIDNNEIYQKHETKKLVKEPDLIDTYATDVAKVHGLRECEAQWPRLLHANDKWQSEKKTRLDSDRMAT